MLVKIVVCIHSDVEVIFKVLKLHVRWTVPNRNIVICFVHILDFAAEGRWYKVFFKGQNSCS
jgi:hypothetical protein